MVLNMIRTIDSYEVAFHHQLYLSLQAQMSIDADLERGRQAGRRAGVRSGDYCRISSRDDR